MSVNPIKGCGFLCAHKTCSDPLLGPGHWNNRENKKFQSLSCSVLSFTLWCWHEFGRKSPKVQDRQKQPGCCSRKDFKLSCWTTSREEQDRTRPAFLWVSPWEMQTLQCTPVAQALEQGMWAIAVALEPIPWHDPNPPRHSKVLFL